MPDTTLDPAISEEISNKTILQIILISLTILIQIILLFKYPLKMISVILFVCIIFISITFAIRVDNETIKTVLFIVLSIIIPILFIINLPFKKFNLYQDNIRFITKTILICSIILSSILTMFIIFQFDQ